MEPGQMEQIEELVHSEEEQSRRELKRYALGLAAVCVTGWMGWVSLGIVKVYSDGYNLLRLEASIEKMLDEHKKDMDIIRSQFSSMDQRIDAMPPKDFRDRVDQMQTQLDRFGGELRQNAVEHQQIIGTIGKIETNQANMTTLLNDIKSAVIK